MNRVSPPRKFLNGSQQGIAVVEFAIVVPLLLLLGLGCLDCARSLRYIQAATTLSREAASVAYRECTNLNAVHTVACLRSIYRALEPLSKQSFTGSEIVISIYEYAPSPLGVRRARRIGRWPLAPDLPAAFASRFDVVSLGLVDNIPGTRAAGQLSGPLAIDLLEEHEIVVIAEAFVPFSGIFNLQRLFSTVAGSAFYDVSII